MRPLLVNPSYSPTKLQQKCFPLGLGYVASSARSEGFDIEVKDMNVETTPIDFCDYDVLGVTAATMQILNAYEIIKTAKEENPEIYTILGGVHASSLPQQCLSECKEIDAVVVGEGERVFPRLLRKPERGVIFAGTIDNLDELSFPARELFPYKKYIKQRPYVYAKHRIFTSMITSRGCPYACYYCCNSKKDRKWRARTPDNVGRELEEIVRLGIKEVHIEDDQFTLDKRRAIAICEHLRHLEIDWTLPNGVHVNTVDRELLEIMRDAGLHQLSYGIESGNQEVLDKIGKNLRLDKIREIAALTKDVGIRVTCFFMFGLMGDTAETMQETIDFAKELGPDNVGGFSLCIPYPSSVMYDWVKNSLIFKDWTQFVHGYATNLRYSHPDFPSLALSAQYLKKGNRDFYLRPRYVLKHLKDINLERIRAILRLIIG